MEGHKVKEVQKEAFKVRREQLRRHVRAEEMRYRFRV